MAQQRIFAPMRSTNYAPAPGGKVNLSDSSQPALDTSSWTGGATLIDPVPISPPLSEKWSVLAWSFTFAGYCHWRGSKSMFGKLGAVWAGLLTEGSPTSYGSSAYRIPMVPMPPDLTTMQKAWDGSVDPMFPSDAASLPGAMVSGAAALNLSSPLTLHSGMQLNFGLWLTPSLTQNTELLVVGAVYSIVYDDGQP
jgi:hypothetical protein